ncbi:hypothetical protein ACROYT_G036255 [Oculina patagonica]
MPHEQKDMEDEYNRIENEPVKRGGTECGWGIGGCPPMLLCIDGYCKRPKCYWSPKEERENQTTKPHFEELRASR